MGSSWMRVEEATASLRIFARLREDVGERGPNLTVLTVGGVGERGGVGVVVDGGVGELGVRLHFRLWSWVLEDNRHMGQALEGLLVGWLVVD